MTCHDAEPFLLDADPSPDVQVHLAGCAECSHLREDLLTTGAMLRDHLDAPVPVDVRTGFYTLLGEAKREQAVPRPSLWLRLGLGRPRLRWALSLATVFVLGALSMLLLRPRTAPLDDAVLAQFESPSSTERLAGVYAVSAGSGRVPHRAIVDALLVTLHTDPSVNVRVAALDALTPFGDRERVRIGVLRALADDPEPLVQMAALRFVEAHQSEDARRALEALLAQPDLEPLVRSEAQTLTVSI